jgi:signal transduction histidine kinase
VRDKLREGIEITMVTGEENGLLFCDREYLRMCLINLLVNSIQAIEDSGTITVEFGKEEGCSFISVTDTGKGISEEGVEQIFEPYYSTKKFGIGLGLTITKRLVEEHGGTIAMASKAGEKTVITIRVPYHEG